jgi:NADH dehydrogenase
VVDKYLTIPDYPDAFACGDVAAVPDLTAPGEVTAMTAQHAQRQGARAAKNIAASLGKGRRRAYKHHDLGFVVDLGGTQAAANPLKLPLDGLVAKAVTRGYHLFALPLMRTRVRVIANWILHLFGGDDLIRIGFLSERKGTVEDFEGADDYLSADQVRERARAS